MITHFKVRCRSFVWYLIVAFTICSIPHFELLPVELAGLLERRGLCRPGTGGLLRGKTADGGGASSGVSVSVSRFTGAAKAHIPIVVAPGRSEATTPKLSLTYSSSRGNGPVGMGWTLDTGYVKRGYKTDDHYLVMDGVSRKLIFLKEENGIREWRTESSDGAIAKICSVKKLAYGFHLNESWKVQTADGTTYYYGTTGESRVVGQTGHLADLGYLYWHLERVVDPNGDTIQYSYDALNRSIQKTPSKGAKRDYTYDAAPKGKGRLSGTTRGDVADRIIGYDAMGRVTKRVRGYSASQKSFETGYAYYLSGKVSELAYPTGHNVKEKKVGEIVKDSQLDKHLIVTVAIFAAALAVIVTSIVLSFVLGPKVNAAGKNVTPFVNELYETTIAIENYGKGLNPVVDFAEALSLLQAEEKLGDILRNYNRAKVLFDLEHNAFRMLLNAKKAMLIIGIAGFAGGVLGEGSNWGAYGIPILLNGRAINKLLNGKETTEEGYGVLTDFPETSMNNVTLERAFGGPMI